MVTSGVPQKENYYNNILPLLFLLSYKVKMFIRIFFVLTMVISVRYDKNVKKEEIYFSNLKYPIFLFLFIMFILW